MVVMKAVWKDSRMAAVKVDAMAEWKVLKMVGKLGTTTVALKAEMLVCASVEKKVAMMAVWRDSIEVESMGWMTAVLMALRRASVKVVSMVA